MADDGKNSNFELALRAHDQQNELVKTTYAASADAANVAMRALLLVNGGAVVALLAFVGAIEAGDNSSTDTTALIDSVYWFSLGVGLAVVTAALAYLTFLCDNWMAIAVSMNWEYPFIVDKRSVKPLNILRVISHVIALATAVSALVAFFVGIESVRSAVAQINL